MQLGLTDAERAALIAQRLGAKHALAYACARSSFEWGEVKILLRRLVKSASGYIHSTELVVRCSVSDTFDEPYGVRLAVSPGGSELEMSELDASLKLMTSIGKKLKKMENELGYVGDNYPEFARRVLVASGVRTVLYERTFNQGTVDRNGLNLKDGIFGLPSVDPRDGKDFLAVIAKLTDDTLEKRGKKKVVA